MAKKNKHNIEITGQVLMKIDFQRIPKGKASNEKEIIKYFIDGGHDRLADAGDGVCGSGTAHRRSMD